MTQAKFYKVWYKNIGVFLSRCLRKEGEGVFVLSNSILY
jgi:hypothetical protein